MIWNESSWDPRSKRTEVSGRDCGSIPEISSWNNFSLCRCIELSLLLLYYLSMTERTLLMFNEWDHQSTTRTWWSFAANRYSLIAIFVLFLFVDAIKIWCSIFCKIFEKFTQKQNRMHRLRAVWMTTEMMRFNLKFIFGIIKKKYLYFDMYFQHRRFLLFQKKD